MKILLSFLILMLPALLHAQEAYIITTRGEKIPIDAGEYSYDTGRKIRYYSGNAIFPKTIKTADVKEIADGESLYKVYALDEQKKHYHLYKVIATAPDKTLLVRFIEPAANASSGNLGAEYYIVDGNLAVLASGEIGTALNKKRAQQERQAGETITHHLKECATLIGKLGKGTTILADGTEQGFTDNIPKGFKVQKGIIHCH